MESFFSNSPKGQKKPLDDSTIKYSFSPAENIFAAASVPEEAEKEPVQAADDPIGKAGKKRLNDLDGNILVGAFLEEDEDKSFLQKTIMKFFPKIYQKRLISSALTELTKISKVANNLLTKKIPYGEQDSTYDDLIIYLSSANSIKAKLKGKI